MATLTINAPLQAGGDNIITVADRDARVYKPIEECTPEELRAERAHRWRLIAKTRRANGRSAPFWLTAAVAVLAIVFAWFKLGGFHIAQVLGIMLDMVLLFQALWSFTGDDAFTERQRKVIDDIEELLRVRKPCE